MSRIADPTAKITLLRAAEEVFADKGLEGAKVEDITRRAGLSKGAFYLHFESKDAALKQIVESFLARCGSFFLAPSEEPDLPEEPDDLVEFCLDRDVQIYEFLWQNRSVMRILTSCQGKYDYLVEAFRADLEQRTREWVNHWRNAGLFRPEVDPVLAAALIGGAYHELSIKTAQADKRPPFEVWLAFALESFIRAFGTPELIGAVERRNPPVSTGIGGREQVRPMAAGRRTGLGARRERGTV